MFKSTIRGFGDRKYVQEDKIPESMELFLKSTFEVDDNDEMISVKFKNIIRSFRNIFKAIFLCLRFKRLDLLHAKCFMLELKHAYKNVENGN